MTDTTQQAATVEVLFPPMSAAIDQIVPAFGKAQAELGQVQKLATGNYGKYADLTACWAEIAPVFKEHGLTVIQRPLPAPPGGVRLQTVILHDESQQWLADGGPTFPCGKPTDPQSAMATLTYLRRGALSANVMLTQQEDDGRTAAATPKAKAAPKVALATVEEREKLTARIKALPDLLAGQIGDRLRADAVVWTQLTKKQAKEVVKWIQECEDLA